MSILCHSASTSAAERLPEECAHPRDDGLVGRDCRDSVLEASPAPDATEAEAPIKTVIDVI